MNTIELEPVSCSRFTRQGSMEFEETLVWVARAGGSGPHHEVDRKRPDPGGVAVGGVTNQLAV